MIWRLLTAVVLSFVILPTASYLAPDPLEASDLAVSDVLLAEVRSQVAKVATVYDIKVPAVRFVDSKAAGVTVEKTSSEGRITEIRLGRPMLADDFRLQPALLDAVLSHETGHAVMIARSEAFPPAAIFLMYAIGLFPFLFSFPTKRGQVGAALSIGVSLSLLCSIPAIALPHLAYQYAILGLTISGVALWVIHPGATKLTARPSAAQVLKTHVPSTRTLALAGLIAIPAFFSAAWVIGGLNSQRELRADVFGACATSPATMKEALLHLTGESPGTIREVLDTFHPSLAERLAVLDAMERDTVKKHVCADLLSGESNLSIAIHSLQ